MSIVWSSDIVTLLVGISLLPAAAIALACTIEWRRQRARLRSVYAAQAIASLLHLADQTMFLLILIVPASWIGVGSGCFFLTILPPMFFGVMQPLAVMVLLFRVTALLPSSIGLVRGTTEWMQSKIPVRVGIGTVFSIGWCLIVTSQVRGKWGVNPTTDRCLYVPDRSINVIAKVVYLITYALIGATYVMALTRHGVWRFLFKRSTPFSNHGPSRPAANCPTVGSKSDGTQDTKPSQMETRAKTVTTAITIAEDSHDATNRLNQALLSVMYRILLAVSTYFLTSSLALANFFAGGAYVQFTIENTCAVLASTFATLSREQDWKAKAWTTTVVTVTAHADSRQVDGKVSVHINGNYHQEAQPV